MRDDDASAALVAAITDPDAETTALTERAVLRRLEAGCAAPVGISARLTDAPQPVVAVIAEVYALDGSRTVRVERRTPRPELADAAGRDRFAAVVVDDLMAAGAGDLADLGPRSAGGAGGGAGPLSTGDRP